MRLAGVCQIMESVKSRCDRCQTFTSHKSIFQYDQNLSEEHFIFNLKYTIFECCGCQNVKFERKESSDYCDFNEHGMVPEITVYPPHTFRQKPEWLSSLTPPFNAGHCFVNQEIIDLINEVYVAIQNGGYRLAIMGIRALIELIMIQEVGDQGAFYKNMNAFQEKGFISKVQKEALGFVLEAGHAAIHRSYKPKATEVTAAIDIVENVLESIYVVQKRQNSLADVPSKKRHNKSV